MAKLYKVCVLGGGAFGTAMAQTAAANSNIASVTMYARNADIVDNINSKGRNPKFFTDYELNSKIKATT
jgi:glycerol-3-phosphate dehydrogenase